MKKELTLLEKYYESFDEEHRLLTRHGSVEYITTMKYIHDYLFSGAKILDIGAGTGRYSISLANEGFDVEAIELVRKNLEIIYKKQSTVKAHQGNALDLSRYSDNTFDITLVFGPMYHLIKKEEKIKALEEAKRVTKKDGIIFVAYVMNDYSIITHGFKKGFIKQIIEEKKISKDFHVIPDEFELYDYLRVEDIDELNSLVKLKRIKIISATGASNYMRPELNKMDEETFNLFIQYHLSTCERKDMIGASSHTVDILRK